MDADWQHRRHLDVLALTRASTGAAMLLAVLLVGCRPAPATADAQAIDRAVAQAELELKAAENMSAPAPDPKS